jgi:hypothetical protein
MPLCTRSQPSPSRGGATPPAPGPSAGIALTPLAGPTGLPRRDSAPTGGTSAPRAPTPRFHLATAEPTNALCVGPMPCEQYAARIGNSAAEALRNEDVPQVARRYLQSREGYQVERNIVLKWAALSLVLGIGLPVLLPTVTTTLRYQRIKRACKEFLIDRMGPETFARLQALDHGNPLVGARLAEIIAPWVSAPESVEQELAENMARAQALLDGTPVTAG